MTASVSKYLSRAPESAIKGVGGRGQHAVAAWARGEGACQCSVLLHGSLVLVHRGVRARLKKQASPLDVYYYYYY
jgi:hypothetical protein